jgi:1,4-alpha-glucan branching enzyme
VTGAPPARRRETADIDSGTSSEAGELGTCCIVLHSHLPWLAHSGRWPVGEEWLYQSWADSYLPVTDLLLRLAREGRTRCLTLGVTPVLAAMLDDPYCLAEFRTWVGDWRLRAEGAVVDALRQRRPAFAAVARDEARRAASTAAALAGRWAAGASPVLRRIVDSGVAEILGGPAAHPFLPLLDERVGRAALALGLDDATIRFGLRPAGIWAPECAYRPGLERLYADAGVTHFLVDGPTVGGETASGYEVADENGVPSGVVAFPRDLDVSYRVWSPTAGYPGGPWYRDFHTYDHPSGLKPSRVTGPGVEPEDKAPYDADAARRATLADAEDFVATVVRRLTEHRDANGRPGLVVVAYDTELFGHWWHEGPLFLETVLRRLPEVGVRLDTLDGARAEHVAGPRQLPASSWGAGKDWHVWTDQRDLVEEGHRVSDRLLTRVDKRFAAGAAERDPRLDQLVREAFLHLSSDWAFLISHDSSPDYARRRAAEHADRFDALADLIEADAAAAHDLAAQLRQIDGPFGTLDARALLDRYPGGG